MAASTKIAQHRRRRRWQFRARSRLYVAIAAGIAVALVIPGPIEPTLRAVVGWDAGIALFLAQVLWMAARATPASMRQRAALEDQARWAFLALMAAAVLIGMFAVLGILHAAHGAGGHVSVELSLLAGMTILLSWIFAHVVFAIHYAHDYYGEAMGRASPGLVFPGAPGDPDYWDFLYFSFVIGMTCQVSDVQVASQPWRRLVLAHGIVSFLYNTLVLALSINLLAGLL
ncbi:MAG TPA: DUF1345 domain-containing protein [Stellaceae bacterium]|nr:DUF1345 domain-containing protein [Stellaceae bacterium]